MSWIGIETIGNRKIAKLFLEGDREAFCTGEGASFSEALSDLGEEMDAMYGLLTTKPDDD